MKIKSLNFALAGALTTAVVWIICSLLVWVMPGPMMSMTGALVHMDMSKFSWELSALGVFGGLIVWSLSAGIFAWLLAAIYNGLTKN